MAKKTYKAKEPIRIRFKRLANGNKSIYLDIYRDGQRVYEFLKMYLVPERTVADRIQNRNTLEAANGIKSQRIIELNYREAGIRNSNRQKILFFEYIEKCIREAKDTHKGNAYTDNLNSVKYHLGAWLGKGFDGLKMKNITPDFCRGFIKYLKAAKTSTGKPLSKVTIYHYTRFFNSILKEAVTEDVIISNPMDKLKKSELCKRPKVDKTYLTADEVAAIVAVDYPNDTIKRAFLFSCFTGLRISDIQALTWANIKDGGDGSRLDVVMRKTDERLEMKLSEYAVSFLTERGKQSEKVFDLPTTPCVDKHIGRMAAAAGIEKHVTFHTARHTFATLGYTAGADIYTVSKLLGHKSVTTTTIYAAMVDKKKDEAITTLDNSICNVMAAGRRAE